jgi:hypothetical protein
MQLTSGRHGEAQKAIILHFFFFKGQKTISQDQNSAARQ